MIKNILAISLLLAVFGNPALAQQNGKQFLLTGKIKGAEEGYIFISYLGAENKNIKDSCAIKNGSFEFKGTIDGPVMASLNGKVQTRSVSDPNFTNLFLQPGNIEITIEEKDYKHAKFNGASIQNEYIALNKQRELVENKYKLQLDSLRIEKNPEKNAEIRERLAPYFAAMDAQDYIFFEAHPQSYVTAYMMRFHVSDLSLDSLELFYNRLGTALQKNRYGKHLLEEIEKLRNGSPGSIAKDFTTTDIEGNKISLADYKGKYVLLDFWASWCIPCRKGNPHMKELYAKYKDNGIEFIGIADDDRAELKWKEAVAKDGIGIWKHVRRGLKYEKGVLDRSTDISDNFGIHTLPTRILIDSKGVIIGRYGEEEKELTAKLKEIFEK